MHCRLLIWLMSPFPGGMLYSRISTRAMRLLSMLGR